MAGRRQRPLTWTRRSPQRTYAHEAHVECRLSLARSRCLASSTCSLQFKSPCSLASHGMHALLVLHHLLALLCLRSHAACMNIALSLVLSQLLMILHLCCLHSHALMLEAACCKAQFIAQPAACCCSLLLMCCCTFAASASLSSCIPRLRLLNADSLTTARCVLVGRPPRLATQ